MAANLTDLGLQPWVYENPQHFQSMWFEKVDGNEMRFWARQQLPLVTVICLIYFLFIHYGPRWMKDRKPFDLQTPLVLWNLLLAVFSVIGTIRILPEFIYVLSQPNGFNRSACSLVGIHYPATFWGMAFTISKVAELGDTVFIVLRKKPLILLHWFHHSTVLLGTFYGYAEGEPYARYCGLINFSVHSVMYTYFTVKAMKIRVPKRISMMITSVQILQFVALLAVNAYTIFIFVTGGDCYRTWSSVILSSIIIGSYLFLFSKLFYNSYMTRPKIKSQ